MKVNPSRIIIDEYLRLLAENKHLELKSKLFIKKIKYFMTCEKFRFDSFEFFQSDFVNKNDLVKAGFFHIRSDIVQCAFCGIALSEWEKDEIPIQEHRKHSPTCQFLNDDTEKTNKEIPFQEILDFSLSEVI